MLTFTENVYSSIRSVSANFNLQKSSVQKRGILTKLTSYKLNVVSQELLGGGPNNPSKKSHNFYRRSNFLLKHNISHTHYGLHNNLSNIKIYIFCRSVMCLQTKPNVCGSRACIHAQFSVVDCLRRRKIAWSNKCFYSLINNFCNLLVYLSFIKLTWENCFLFNNNSLNHGSSCHG